MVDFLMTILLLLLMAFQITGQEFHEWLGAGMLVLLLAHNILNYRWYKNLFREKYGVIRILQTAINTAVLVSMICLAYSGIVMSRYVFGFISGGMAIVGSIVGFCGILFYERNDTGICNRETGEASTGSNPSAV